MGDEGQGKQKASPSERDSNRISFFIGAACGVALAAVIIARLGHFEPLVTRYPLAGGIVGGVILLAFVGYALYKRSWLGLLIPVVVTPGIIAGVLDKSAGHHTATSGALEAVSFMLVFSLAIGTALFYSRRVRELEQRLFSDATSAAFFVTVLAAGIYGALELFVKVPRVGLIWVPVFGAVVWATLEWLFRRRYS